MSDESENKSLSTSEVERLDSLNRRHEFDRLTAVSTDLKFTRLHWSSLFFDVVSHSRNYLIPAVIALFSAARGNSSGVIIAGLLFFPSLIFSILRYFTLRIRIQDSQFVVSSGLLFQRIRTIPVARIQNIDLVQSVWHRLLGVAEVRVETASGSEPEAILRVLSLQQVELLRQEIFGDSLSPAQQNFGEQQAVGGSEKDAVSGCTESSASLESLPVNDNIEATGSTPAHVQTLVEIPLGWLIRAGLASNRGTIIVGLALGLAYQFELLERINLSGVQRILPQNFDWFLIAITGLVLLVIVTLLLRFLGIAWYVLRFYGYRLSQHGPDLRISCGLLTKVSATVPQNRIQLISVQQNLLLRWLGMTSIRIETAGGGANLDDASQTVSRRWFLPVLPENDLPGILRQLRPGFEWQQELPFIDWQTVSHRAFARKLRQIVLIAVIAAGVASYFLPPWGWSLGVVVLTYSAVTTWLDLRSRRYGRLPGGVVYQSGFWEQKTTFTFFDRVQSIQVSQSPFDRRWQMAVLLIDTAGAGPAEHSLRLPCLDASFVFQEYDLLTGIAASQPACFA